MNVCLASMLQPHMSMFPRGGGGSYKLSGERLFWQAEITISWKASWKQPRKMPRKLSRKLSRNCPEIFPKSSRQLPAKNTVYGLLFLSGKIREDFGTNFGTVFVSFFAAVFAIVWWCVIWGGVWCPLFRLHRDTRQHHSRCTEAEDDCNVNEKYGWVCTGS